MLAGVEDGAEYVSAALNNARTSPSPTVIMGRTSEAVLWVIFLILLEFKYITPHVSPEFKETCGVTHTFR
jgi:hypothetical protein